MANPGSTNGLNKSNQEDLMLVRQVQNGNKQAFNALFIKYQYRILKLIARYVRDPADLHDVKQEVFIKIYRSLPNFRGDSAFFTWIYRIAINTAKNYLISQDRRPININLDISDAEQMEDFVSLRDLSTPENALECKETATKLIAALHALPETLREAVTLREVEGETYDNIAQIMHCPVGTVRSRIFRAREHILSSVNNS